MRYLRYLTIILALMLAATAWSDDGEMFRKNVSKTPELETEHAALRMLPLYVPAQTSDGTLLGEEGIEYPLVDGSTEQQPENRLYARPLITLYTDGHVEGIEEEGYGGFPGHGKRDAYGAVSLDDGASWKRTNLSKSADLSSFKIKDGKMKVPYPGDVGRTFAASDGNKVLMVWVSRYARGGNPNYAMTNDERGVVAEYLGLDVEACTDENLIDTPCLYLEDHFGVAGSQGSSDLADEGYPLVGELPYAAVWVARGVILPPAAEGESSTFVWFKAERLSSAVRDANRPEAVCVKGAGCVVTWQEDPEGIRPGEGEGPGEGWSGAIAHHQTDTWYSYIDWDDFDLVIGDEGYGSLSDEAGDLTTWVADNANGTPQAAIPMSIPVRLTDNAMCTDTSTAPFCHIDFDGNGTPDYCASTVEVTIVTPEGPTQGLNMCVTEDGRLMRGNTASTRARLGLHGYSTTVAFVSGEDNTDFYDSIDSAWFSMAYEENKGLGEDGEEAILSTDPLEKIDMGKNVWYHTFDMFNPEVVSQGLMLNQPAVYPEDFTDPLGVLFQDTSLGGYNFYQIDPDPIYETLTGQEDTASILYQTEIARRPSPITQDWYDAGTTGTVALQLWKQGIIRRGGPADIMGRRFVIPDEFNSIVDNPYDYGNMACETWAFTDGSNPRYVKGLCADPAINLSGNTILTGDPCTDATSCQDAFPFSEYFDDLDMTQATDGLAKILTWEQTGPDYGETITNPTLTNLDDTSWENPYDVAKGHRGFMAGDYILAMYAWSPNWMANTVGHDNYNLYARRSFDGGKTWTTTPSAWSPDGIDEDVSWTADGTTTCEWMGPAGSDTEELVCTTYGAGDFEQARNLSQLVGTKETILDPRYSPTTRSITKTSVSTALPEGFTAPLYDDDTRDPSRFFMVYETGDNTTVAVGEAEPLDLFYSRAVNWGDDYLVWQDEPTTDCLPGEITTDSGTYLFCNEFDALEGSQFDESGEASITSSPGGQFFYSVWNQWDFDRDGEEVGADAWFRRVLFLDDYVPTVDDDSGDPGEEPEDPVVDPVDPGDDDPAPTPTKPGKSRTSTVDTTTSITTTTTVVVKGKKSR